MPRRWSDDARHHWSLVGLDRRCYRAYRGLIRIATTPTRRLPENGTKTRVRLFVLRHQHSLPTELAANRGDVVVQVGTPHPTTVKRFRRAVGDSGRLLIVEAMPDNRNRLAEAVREAGHENVTIIEAAACNESREGVLAVSPLPGDHRIPLSTVMDNDSRPENASMSLIPVRYARLDDLLAEQGVDRVDYLSVTVNGAELEVLRGAAGVLRAAPPGARVYAKGHALGEDGQPIHVATSAFMESLGYNVMVTAGEPSSSPARASLRRAGDLYAWIPAR